MMFIHQLNPVLVNIGPFSIYYYSLAYLAGALMVWLTMRWAARNNIVSLDAKQIESFITYLIIGTILGGRLGYFLFYAPSTFFTNPLVIPQIWTGGMSFHGGLIGIAIALYLFSKKYKIPILVLGDIMSAPAALGLSVGRLTNFINGEVVGTPTNVSWCVVFPNIDQLCRHPSQIYEAGYSFVLAGITWLGLKKGGTGLASGLFLTFYGTFRLLTTFLRDDMRYLGLSTGQYLSLATAIAGLWLLYRYKLARSSAKKE